MIIQFVVLNKLKTNEYEKHNKKNFFSYACLVKLFAIN
jgi:hypothetical protein